MDHTEFVAENFGVNE